MAQLSSLIQFTSGTPAIAADVNQNFNDIRNHINGTNIDTENIADTLTSRAGGPILFLNQSSQNQIALVIQNSQTNTAMQLLQSAVLANATKAVLKIEDPITQTTGKAELWLSLAAGSTIPALLVEHGAVKTFELTSSYLRLETLFKPTIRTTAQRNAITNPEEGSVLYNTDTNELNIKRSDKWMPVSIPVGSMQIFAGSVAPEGWLLCGDVTLNSIANPEYAKLFAVIGTTYGGTGASSFKLPDTRGRTIIGVGTGIGLTARALAAIGGAETHLLTTNESGQKAVTTSTTTTLSKGQDSEEGGSGSTYIIVGDGGEGQGTLNWNHSHSIAGSSAAQAHNNMQPFIALNYIIKY